jgi:hypothetical protein
MDSLTRRVASTWAFKKATEGGSPIPLEVLQHFFGGKTAYALNSEEGFALHEAQESVNLFLPKILEMLFRKQGDRYYMTASESRGRIFYYFAPRHPLDAFNLGVSVHNGKAMLFFGYTPMKVGGGIDLQGMISEKAVADTEVAGLAVMRLVRSVLSKI